MLVQDLMATDVLTVAPDDSLREAARLMDGARVKLLPVCEGDRVVGVITDSDVICAVGDGCVPDREFVRSYMTTAVATVGPETSLEIAGQLMSQRRIHHLVVCDDDRLRGVVNIDVVWSELGGVAEPRASFATAY